SSSPGRIIRVTFVGLPTMCMIAVLKPTPNFVEPARPCAVVRLALQQDSGLLLEVRNLLSLLLYLPLSALELVFRLALLLLLRTLSAQGRIPGEIPDRLLRPAGGLVLDSHSCH